MVRVLVVIIMRMSVSMSHFFMSVLVLMKLGQMEPNADRHQ